MEYTVTRLRFAKLNLGDKNRQRYIKIRDRLNDGFEWNSK